MRPMRNDYSAKNLECCGNCKFRSSETTEENEETFYCLRFPPTYCWDPAAKLDAIGDEHDSERDYSDVVRAWANPPMWADDWCGEWKPMQSSL